MTVQEYRKLGKGKYPKKITKKKGTISKMESIEEKPLFFTILESMNLPKPKTEYHFAEDYGRDWRADYYFEVWVTEKIQCLDVNRLVKIAVEIEGGIWSKKAKSRHTTGSGFFEDMQKYNCYSMLGITLLRFTPDELQNNVGKVTDILNICLFGEKNIGEICRIIKK